MKKKVYDVFAKPLYVTLKHSFKHPVTTLYPDEKLNEGLGWEHLAIKDMWISFRGCQALNDEICVGCSLCARNCPEGAIKMVIVKEPKLSKKRPQINLGRCSFCGFCIEACPTNALTMADNYELADYSRESLIYTPKRLIEIGKKYKAKEFPREKGIFYAEVDIEKCIGCGVCAKKYAKDVNTNLQGSYPFIQLCIKECPMDAIEIVEIEENGKKVRKSKIDKEKCIGCYNCIEACRSCAISLKLREEKK